MASTDPYTPPTSELDTGRVGGIYSHGIAAFIVVFTVVVHIIGYRFAAGFAELFQGFGAELPWLTMLFVSGPLLYFVLPCLGVLSYIVRRVNVKVGGRMLVGVAIATCVMFPLCIGAMYLPIYQMGEVL